MTGLVMDIVLLVISILLIITYTRKGFVKTILDIAKTIISIFLAYCLRNPVGKMIDAWFMKTKVTSWVHNSLSATFSGEDNFVDFISIYNDVPSFYKNILTRFGLDLGKFEEELSNFQNGGEESINALAENIGSSLSMMFSVILAILAVFAVSIIVLTIVVHMLNLLTKFSTINFVNRLLGFVFGILMAVLVIWLVNFVVGLLITYVGPLRPDIFNNSIIEKSVVLKIFNENNFMQFAIDKLRK